MLLNNGGGIAPVYWRRWRNVILIFDSRLQRVRRTSIDEGVIAIGRIDIALLCIVWAVRRRLIKAALMASAWPQRLNMELRFLIRILPLGIAIS